MNFKKNILSVERGLDNQLIIFRDTIQISYGNQTFSIGNKWVILPVIVEFAQTIICGTVQCCWLLHSDSLSYRFKIQVLMPDIEEIPEFVMVWYA